MSIFLHLPSSFCRYRACRHCSFRRIVSVFPLPLLGRCHVSAAQRAVCLPGALCPGAALVPSAAPSSGSGLRVFAGSVTVFWRRTVQGPAPVRQSCPCATSVCFCSASTRYSTAVRLIGQSVGSGGCMTNVDGYGVLWALWVVLGRFLYCFNGQSASECAVQPPVCRPVPVAGRAGWYYRCQWLVRERAPPLSARPSAHGGSAHRHPGGRRRHSATCGCGGGSHSAGDRQAADGLGPRPPPPPPPPGRPVVSVQRAEPAAGRAVHRGSSASCGHAGCVCARARVWRCTLE